MLSYPGNFSPCCEHPHRAGAFQGCRKLGLSPCLQPWASCLGSGLIRAMTLHEGCPLEGGFLTWVGDFPCKWKAGDQARPEYPGNIFGEGKAKKDKLQWEGPPNILFRQENTAA